MVFEGQVDSVFLTNVKKHWEYMQEKHCKNQCFFERVQKLKNPPPGQATCGTAVGTSSVAVWRPPQEVR